MAVASFAAQRPTAVGGSIQDRTVPGLLSADTQPQPSPTISETAAIAADGEDRSRSPSA